MGGLANGTGFFLALRECVMLHQYFGGNGCMADNRVCIIYASTRSARTIRTLYNLLCNVLPNCCTYTLALPTSHSTLLPVRLWSVARPGACTTRYSHLQYVRFAVPSSRRFYFLFRRLQPSNSRYPRTFQPANSIPW